MSLREKAEAEVAEDRRKAEEETVRRRSRERQQHHEEAKPAAEFLAEWTGMPVDVEQLEREDELFPGFHSYRTWTITIDGFDLAVKQEKRQKPMLAEHTADWAFQLYQRLSSGETRHIDRPADLLDPVGVVA